MNNFIKIVTAFALLVLILSLVGNIKQNQNTKISQKAICNSCNVIIVGYDTVGASHVSSLGYNRLTTPMLDTLANQGFLFTKNIASASWTVPSFMSLFTGLYPTEHKVINKFSIFNKNQQVISNLKKLSPNTETLAEVFRKQGYITGGFTGDAGVSGQFGYKDGFDTYIDDKKFGSIGNSANYALEWLKKNKDKKFFMFLHGYDAHGQFNLPPSQAKFISKDYKGPFTGSPQEQAILREQQLTQKISLTPSDVAFWNELYDSKIRDGDDRFAKFWGEFVKMGLDKNTIIVVLSDHGEEIYEHGGIDHGQTLYDELIHVPLIFKVPGMTGNKKITQQVTTIDVAPTLFDILGIKPSKNYESQIRGISLLPLMQGKSEQAQDVFTETDYREFTHKRAIRTANDWKYILTMESGKAELYNLKTDSGEKNNVIEIYPQIAINLDKKLKDHIKNMGDNPNKEWTVGCLPVYVGECE